MGDETVLGVNFAAGIAYFGAVARPCVPIVGRFLKSTPPMNVDCWERLKQFGEQVASEARASNAIRIVFADPRLANHWVYSEAAERVSLQTAAALALRSEGRAAQICHPKTAATLLGFGGKIKSMDEGLAALLRIDSSEVTHWKHRLPAFAVAAAIARGIWNG